MAGEETPGGSGHERIGDFLVKLGIVSRDQLKIALDGQKREPNKRLGQVLVELGFIKDASVVDALQFQTKARLQCSKCDRIYRVQFYNPDAKYTCKICKGHLQTVATTSEPSVILKPTTKNLETTTTPREFQDSIGDLLVKRGVITPDQLKIALDAQKREPKKHLGQVLVDQRFIEDQSIVDAIQAQARVDLRCSKCDRVLTGQFQVLQGI